MQITEITAEVLSGGQSAQIAISSTSAQGPLVSAPTNHPTGVPVKCLVTPDTICFCRKGTNPTALSNGTDQILLANTTYRVELLPGERMAFVTASASGNVYFTPGA